MSLHAIATKGLLAAIVVCVGLMARPVRWCSDWATCLKILSARGLSVDKGQIIRLTKTKQHESLWGRVRVVARVCPPGGLAEIYALTLWKMPWGKGLFLLDAANWTRSSLADETDLFRIGPFVAALSKVQGRYDAFVVYDTRGEPSELSRSWSWFSRLQNSISNLQETGQLEGIGKYRFAFVPPASQASVNRMGEKFELHVEGRTFLVDPASPMIDDPTVMLTPPAKAEPGLITWVVDYVRHISWIGPKPIEWLEHEFFGLKDAIERRYYRWFKKPDARTFAAQLSAPETTPSQKKVSISVGAMRPNNWPPDAITPPLGKGVRGEGEWVPVEDPYFVNAYPGAPTAFYQTFVRSDPERTFAPIYITVWNPSLVQLHIVMGTKEPESATGETGTGEIPKNRETVPYLVAAFNGGFQAMHGEFGMMADGRVYLPPKPWAATVAVFKNGQVAMGSWPAPANRRGYDENEANAQIPSDMIAMRQNLTSVVEDGVYNPWKRWWWGAAPLNAREQTFTHRTGLCLTRQGHMAYFWGTLLGSEALGVAMNSMQCVRGMHLDMNSGHCGFEFYTTSPENTPWPRLGRPLDETFEAEGTWRLSDQSSYRYRVKKAIKTMENLRFPRYTTRDARDFFFLTLKPVLPGAPLQVEGLSIPFQMDDTNVKTYPPALAKAVWKHHAVVRMDPRRVEAVPYESLTEAMHVVAWETPAVSKTAPESVAKVVKGVDDDGFLVFAKTAATQVFRLSLKQQAATQLYLQNSANSTVDLEGRATRWRPKKGDTAWVETQNMPTKVLFADTRPAPYGVWGWLQGQRVRYIPQAPPRFRMPGISK